VKGEMDMYEKSADEGLNEACKTTFRGLLARNYFENGGERRRIRSGCETFAALPMLQKCSLEQHRKAEGQQPAPQQQARKEEPEEEDGSGGSTSVPVNERTVATA
jgi:hypothetical protein